MVCQMIRYPTYTSIVYLYVCISTHSYKMQSEFEISINLTNLSYLFLNNFLSGLPDESLILTNRTTDQNDLKLYSVTLLMRVSRFNRTYKSFIGYRLAV